ncbi:colicin E3/pyocin S6 family cytotoxin [Rosenbergiella nectarea]
MDKPGGCVSNHLGEFNPITGEQTKSADPTRKVEK